MPLCAAAQSCANGIPVDGVVTDSSGAVIAGARVQAANGETTESDAAGHFMLACVPADQNTITAQAGGFSSLTTYVTRQAGGIAHIQLQLAVAGVETDVEVNGNSSALDADRSAGSRTLSASDVQQLPDDPDDLAQELQLMASSGGSIPDLSTITIDGFQNSGVLPPKSSIASIRVNPDQYSPEYEQGNGHGGRIEIFTKPGSDSFHGALFFSDSDGSFNATNPFSVTATPAGKRRYGFEFSGPIVQKKSGFTLALEKRDIDEFNVVNAVTLDANYNQTPLHETVDAPQRLWIASARGDWQVTPKNVATLSFSANVNDGDNQGVGGFVLPEAGYSSLVSEYDLRFTNMLTWNENLLHETRIGYSWKRTEQTPLSTAPALQVAGYFTGGGATSQNLNEREGDLEIDDDVMLTHGKHSWKFGAQSLGLFIRNYVPDTFNGAFVFGGGSAPVLNATNATTTISAIEQYRRALLNLPGGTPTTYQVTTGNPVLSFTQWRLALFAADTIKFTPRLTVTTGLRYQFQTAPSSVANILPRVGIAWALDQKSRWVVHLRVGLFNTPLGQNYAAQVYRLNGVRQRSTLVYSPSYDHPLTPVAGSIQVGTRWQFPHDLDQSPSGWFEGSLEGDLKHNLHPSVWFAYGSEWGNLRTRNINAPLVSSSSGAAPDPTAALLAPRPIMPDMNIMQYENSSHLGGFAQGAGVDYRGKRVRLNVGYWYVDFSSDGSWNGPVSPQSSYSNKGESSRPDLQRSGALVENDIHFPYKIDLSTQFYLHTGTPYNIITGTDANGDGVFNDRPSYTSESASHSGVYNTRFGAMTTNTVNGDVPRNLGTMPSILHMYTNLSRAFNLGPMNADHPRTLTFNARSVNVLNRTNVTAVNTILSSSALGQPITAEAARRIELGVRFAF
ncbi:MAG TPA: TonB-dependent receptor [Pseudacidobacterium sp.]|nr:TonB-dependent receptor [Pseudacidobacterium sp.]